MKGVSYTNLYSGKASAIISSDDTGLVNKGEEGVEESSLWADVIYSMWKRRRIGGGDLKIIVREWITNFTTCHLIRELLPETLNGRLYIWVLTPKDDLFYALLESPAAKGAAYLSIMYTNSMKQRVVKQITVFYHSEHDIYYLAVEFGYLSLY